MLGIGCSPTAVSALSPRAPPATARASPPLVLETQVDTTSARLPLVVVGWDIAFSDVDRALEQSIDEAVAQPSNDLATRGAGGLKLLVELVDARAERHDDRLVVHMLARATLREASGNAYIAQTQVLSSASGSIDRERGAKVVRDCADKVGSQLSGWLAGINLE
jgi:hypothetical protein